MATKAPENPIRLDPAAIGNMMDSAPIYVSGRAQDLVRDAHDQPVHWLHNAHAQPDDRRGIFLVGRGWSATRDRLDRLESAGIPWMAINDYPQGGPRPRYWCTGDPPGFFPERIWEDPEVMKFSPISGADGLRPRDGAYEPKRTPREAPNTHFFNHCYDDPTWHTWLHVPWINWGTSMCGENVPRQWFKDGAARSSLFVGLRLCWHLGYRDVYLLGCDCTPGQHPAPMYWPTVFYLCTQLIPTFKRFGLGVYQTSPDSHLRYFPFVDFDEVVTGEADYELQLHNKKNNAGLWSDSGDFVYESNVAVDS